MHFRTIAICTAAIVVPWCVITWAQTDNTSRAAMVAEINTILRAHPDAKCRSAELTVSPAGQLTLRDCYTFNAKMATLDADHIATFGGDYVAVYCKNSSRCVTVSQGNLPTASKGKDEAVSDDHLDMSLAPDTEAARRLVAAWRRLIVAASSSASPAK
jgi:hypothetical protein